MKYTQFTAHFRDEKWELNVFSGSGVNKIAFASVAEMCRWLRQNLDIESPAELRN